MGDDESPAGNAIGGCLLLVVAALAFIGLVDVVRWLAQRVG